MEGWAIILAGFACASACAVAIVAIFAVLRQSDAHRRDAEAWALRFMIRDPEDYLSAREELKRQDSADPGPLHVEREPTEPAEPADVDDLDARRESVLTDIEGMDEAMEKRAV